MGTMMSKVPEVTLFFWTIKVLVTTVGETAADFLSETLNLGDGSSPNVSPAATGHGPRRRCNPSRRWWHRQPTHDPSGVSEIDTLANALADSSERINGALARERRFSADVSHQLRTPLTGMCLRLETARAAHDPHAIDVALYDLQGLEQTVDHLLAFARDAIPATSTVRLDTAATEAVQRWQSRVATLGRAITKPKEDDSSSAARSPPPSRSSCSTPKSTTHDRSLVDHRGRARGRVVDRDDPARPQTPRGSGQGPRDSPSSVRHHRTTSPQGPASAEAGQSRGRVRWTLGVVAHRPHP